MFNAFMISIFTLIVAISPVFAQEGPFYIDNSGEVALPNAGYSPEFEILKREVQQRQSESKRWKHFQDTYGTWYALWNEYTSSPNRLFGEGFQLPTFAIVNESNAEQAARAALVEFSEILMTDEKELVLVSIQSRENKVTVQFQQEYKSLPVLNSTVSVKMSDFGRVFVIGNDFQPGIDVNTTPTISKESAIVASFTGFGDLESMALEGMIDDNGIRVEGGDLYILPYESIDGLSRHLVYELTLFVDEMGIWRTYVDAHNGKVLWRYNIVHSGIDGQITASVRKDNVLQTPQTVDIGGMYVNVDGQNVTTAPDGSFTSSRSGSVSARLRGPYVKVTNGGGADALVTATVTNNGTFDLHWDDSNSSGGERNAFAHMTRSHNFLKSLDPTFTGMDYQIAVDVNKTNGSCNAYWNGSGMGYYRAALRNGVMCANTAEMIEVVAHEYGHGINQKLYQSQGQTNGMINGSLNEGLADVNPCLMLDTPAMGVGFFNSNPLRNLDNTRRYPDDVDQDIHITGLIVGGAVWDMRESIGLTLARNLSHYAKYDTPNDPDVGTVFTQYLVAILAEDDNDANLANGTPNAVPIVTAFRIHGIPSSIFVFNHQPIVNATSNQLIPLSTLITPDFPGITASTVKLKYRVKGNHAWTTITLNLAGGNPGGTTNWTGAIPPQMSGTIIEYYLEASDALLGLFTYPARGAADPILFPVNFLTHAIYDFETNQGWTSGIAGDNATTGMWERGDPNGTTRGTSPVQPEDDHSNPGVNCWFTENANPGQAAGVKDVDGGRTTLLSPVFSVLNLTQPCIRYWRWFSNDLGDAPRDDDWQTQISNNGGASWKDIEKSNVPFNSWMNKFIVISDYVAPTGTMRLRFIARDDAPGSIVEAAVDDVEILYENPVPVELANFSARRYDNLVHLQWTTASETNNYGFEVESQLDNEESWTNEGFVSGQGSTTLEQQYSHSFSEASGRTVYVRLKQIDFDGSFNYSPVIEVSADGFSFVLHQNYPNPFNPSTRIRFDLPATHNANIDIVNSFGQIVKSIELGELKAGTHDTNVTMDNLPSGMYIYRLQAGGKVMTRSMHLVR
jgi:Zn-dependent metalloprotease